MTEVTLFLHIGAGIVALGMAGLALGTAKGGIWHRRAGLPGAEPAGTARPSGGAVAFDFAGRLKL